MAGCDVEQRVTRLDEIRRGRADRRSQRGVDVGLRALGCARRRAEQQRGEREGERRAATAIALLPALLVAACAFAPAPPPAPPPVALDVSTTLAVSPACPRIAHIEVRKSERLLVARCDPGPVLVVKVALGRAPVGAKETQGDQRTPEGHYRVTGPAERSAFHRFIPIDYPSRHDADAALARGAIRAAEHARIVARRAHDRPPPQDTALGGTLGLHGEGPRWQGESAGLDWTLGCIAMRDHEIEFLAQRVGRGTPVWIVP